MRWRYFHSIDGRHSHVNFEHRSKKPKTRFQAYWQVSAINIWIYSEWIICALVTAFKVAIEMAFWFWYTFVASLPSAPFHHCGSMPHESDCHRSSNERQKCHSYISHCPSMDSTFNVIDLASIFRANDWAKVQLNPIGNNYTKVAN